MNIVYYLKNRQERQALSRWLLDREYSVYLTFRLEEFTHAVINTKDKTFRLEVDEYEEVGIPIHPERLYDVITYVISSEIINSKDLTRFTVLEREGLVINYVR